jgi:GTP-binding protein
MMEDYLEHRQNLRGICLLVDLRRLPSADDQEIYHFFKTKRLPVLLVGTKLDKLKRNEIKKNDQMIRQKLNFDPTDTFIKVSNLDKTNLGIVYNELNKLLKRG